MKLHILFSVLFVLAPLGNLNASSPQPQASAKTSNNKITNSSSSAKQIVDDTKDGQVVAESMGTMIAALTTFSQNPNNPVVAGACALQALGAFIKMLIQIFDDFAPVRTGRSSQEIQKWLLELPKEKRLLMAQFMIAYLHTHAKNSVLTNL